MPRLQSSCIGRNACAPLSCFPILAALGLDPAAHLILFFGLDNFFGLARHVFPCFAYFHFASQTVALIKEFMAGNREMLTQQ